MNCFPSHLYTAWSSKSKDLKTGSMATVSSTIFPSSIPRSVCNGFNIAIKQAKLFVGKTSPNPPVGCTLLDKDGEIIACKAHQYAGSPHAEQLAVSQAQEDGRLKDIDTAIVTLEPCNHIGRTPSCSSVLAQTPVKTVYIGCRDSNTHVKGGGAQALSQKGIKVIWLAPNSAAHSLFGQCCSLHAAFKKKCQTGLPWITVKQAVRQQGDDFTMFPPPGQKTFTSQDALKTVHELRHMTSGIITTGATIRDDAPLFTIRFHPDPDPIRRLLIICSQNPPSISSKWIEKRKKDFDIIMCEDVKKLPYLFKEQSVNWLMIEAGPSFLKTIKENVWWDDWLVFAQSKNGEEACHFASRHQYSPLNLLSQSINFTEEQVCFPEL